MTECPTCKGTGEIELPDEKPGCDKCDDESLYSYHNPISNVEMNLCYACLDELVPDFSAEQWIEKGFAKAYPISSQEVDD